MSGCRSSGGSRWRTAGRGGGGLAAGRGSRGVTGRSSVQLAALLLVVLADLLAISVVGVSLDALAEGGLADEPRKRVLVLVNLGDGAVLALAGELESALCVSSATCIRLWSRNKETARNSRE